MAEVTSMAQSMYLKKKKVLWNKPCILLYNNKVPNVEIEH